MSDQAYINQAQKLIQVFSGISSTEDLVIFVAGTDGMLAFCQELIDQFDRNTQLPLIQDVATICSAKGVLPGALFAEARKVLLALNRFHDAGQDHYGVLGLKSGASVDEIKKAYRRLSKEHHPDRNLDSPESGKRFMEIAGAYHALMIGAGKRKTEESAPWRKKTSHGPGILHRKERKFFLILAITLVVSLSGFSIYLSAWYNRQAAISQLPSYTMAKGNENPAIAPQTKEDPPAATAADSDAAPATLEPPHPVEEQPTISQAEVEAGDQLYQLAAEAPRPPVPEQKSEPEGSIAQDEPTPSDSANPAMAPETAAPVQTVSMSEPRPAAAARKEIQVTPTAYKQTNKQEIPPSAEDIKDIQVTQNDLPPDESEDSRGISDTVMIKGVINHYQEHYSKRELASFLDLFAEDATENGQPVAKLGDQYRSLFDHTQAIKMQIHDANWNPSETGFRIQGRFNANYTYHDGRSKEHIGDISFYLVNDHGELKIQTLEYVFKE